MPLMQIDPESYYRQLGRLIESMPDFWGFDQFTSETHQWLGRADALIMASGEIMDKVEWRTVVMERYRVKKL